MKRSCSQCGGSGWLEDPDTGRPLTKCDQCAHTSGGDQSSLAIRSLLLERVREGGEFTAEDVFRWTRFAGSNAVGGVVSSLASEGVIVRVGTRRSSRSARNGGTAALWTGAAAAAAAHQLSLPDRRR